MPKQTGGGSIGQSLKYVDPQAHEQTAAAGGDILKATPLIARPAIGGGTRKRKGGFYPSVMAGVVDNALLVGPLAAFAGRKLLSRKGGGPKGNIWKAQQAQAKEKLLEVAKEFKNLKDKLKKPTAQNIVKYAAKKRNTGSEGAQELLEEFRKRLQERNEARQAKNSKKATKKQAREALKQAKAVAKAVKDAAKAATKVVKEGTKKVRAPRANKGTKRAKKAQVTKNNERPMTNLQMRRLAEANAAAAKAAMKKTLKPGQSAWQDLIQQAKARLATEGQATLKDAMQLASLMKEGKNTTQFISNFRTRTVPTTTVAAPQTAKKRTVKTTTTVAAPQTVAAPPTAKKRTVKTTTTVVAPPTEKPKKEASESQQAYFKALSNARTYLGTIGAVRGPNMSKYASMVVKKQKETDPEKIRALEKTMKNWEENFKTRRPLSMAKASKTTTKAKTPKKLTTVKENNRNTEGSENSMQGYSENFESEPETNKNEN